MSLMTIDDIKNLDEEQKLSLYYAMKGDSSLFSRIVMAHVVRDMPPIHKKMYSILNDMKGPSARYNYAAMVLFRGAAKSTIKTFDAIHDIVHAHEPVSLFLSEAEDQSIRDLVAIQDEIENNDVLKFFYGELKGEALWNRTECECANGVYIAAKGWRSKVRGIKWKMQRPTKIWLDDFEGESNSKTPEARAAVTDWINRQVLPAGDTHPKTIFLGTIVSPEAFLAKIKTLDLFNGPNGVYLEQAIAETMDGDNPAWESRYPREWILAKKRYYQQINRMSDFLQEYFNIPAESSDPKFSMNLVEELSGVEFGTYMNETFLKTLSGQYIPMYTFVGVDVARPENKTRDNDRTVIYVIGIVPSGNVVILDIYADRINVIDQMKAIFTAVTKYRPQHVTIETYGYQRSLADWVREKMPAFGEFFTIVEFEENKSKSKKFLEGLVPYINESRVCYINGCRGIDLFMQEAKNYSGGIRDHDDTIDGMFLALHKSYPPPAGYDVKARIEKLKAAVKNKRTEPVRTWMTL